MSRRLPISPWSPGKKIRLVLTERQANGLLMYVRALHEHGAGREVAKDMRAIRLKLEHAMAATDRTTDTNTPEDPKRG